MMFLSKKIFIVSLFSLLAVAVSIWLFLNLLGRVTVLRGEVNELVIRIAEGDARRKAARESTFVLESRKEQLKRLDKFFIKKDQPVPFVEKLESSAKKLGNKFTIELDENKKAGENMFFRLSISGSESSVKNYLHFLELLPYKIKVEEIFWQRAIPESGGLQNFPVSPAGIKMTDTLTLLISVKSL